MRLTPKTADFGGLAPNVDRFDSISVLLCGSWVQWGHPKRQGSLPVADFSWPGKGQSRCHSLRPNLPPNPISQRYAWVRSTPACFCPLAVSRAGPIQPAVHLVLLRPYNQRMQQHWGGRQHHVQAGARGERKILNANIQWPMAFPSTDRGACRFPLQADQQVFCTPVFPIGRIIACVVNYLHPLDLQQDIILLLPQSDISDD